MLSSRRPLKLAWNPPKYNQRTFPLILRLTSTLTLNIPLKWNILIIHKNKIQLQTSLLKWSQKSPLNHIKKNFVKKPSQCLCSRLERLRSKNTAKKRKKKRTESVLSAECACPHKRIACCFCWRHTSSLEFGSNKLTSWIFSPRTVCNFIVHEKCVTNVVTPCSGVAPCLIKNPVAHCWSEPAHHKRRFCNVCRKRLDETAAVHCMSKFGLRISRYE